MQETLSQIQFDDEKIAKKNKKSKKGSSGVDKNDPKIKQLGELLKAAKNLKKKGLKEQLSKNREGIALMKKINKVGGLDNLAKLYAKKVG